MGADLYRSNESGKNKGKEVPILGFERSAKAVDVGYFRDAYNSGSILATFDLSWWVDISKLQDGEGVLSLENIKVFRAILDDKVFEDNIKDDKKKDQEYFRKGAGLLKRFLDEAIADEDTIRASL